MGNKSEKCILGITMGDPAGSGPEIVVKTLASQEMYDISRPLVIGEPRPCRPRRTFVAGRVRSTPLGTQTYADAGRQCGVIDVLDLRNVDLAHLVRGRVDPMAGKAAYEYIVKGTELALAGKTGAIVTSAINKDSSEQGRLPLRWAHGAARPPLRR